MKKTIAILEVKRSVLGFDALVAPTQDGVFWLAGNKSGLNNATERNGQMIEVTYSPDDQFAYEVKND